MKKRIQITLTEFGNRQTFSVHHIQQWISTGKFDKRYPWEYVKKWLDVNASYLTLLDISFKWDDNTQSLLLVPGRKIGLLPLKDPYGRRVYGSIGVRPRLGWMDLYVVLQDINWRYQPCFLKTEEPIMSSGVLPRWFKAIDTLEAINQALDVALRKMYRKCISSGTPQGQVKWNHYATRSVPRGQYAQFVNVITDYSLDIDVHRQFKGILQLIAQDVTSLRVPFKVRHLAKHLIRSIENKLETVATEFPAVEKLVKLKVPALYRSGYQKAIQRCIEYLEQSRFAMRGGYLYGLPWIMEMDRLFEFWVEHWASVFAKRLGARLYSSIRQNSKMQFYNLKNWRSLQSLKPDVVVEKGDKTLLIEVKYKKHLVYLHYGRATDDVIAEHRHDIHQLLAYMVGGSQKIIGCLLYPAFDKSVSGQFSTLVGYTNARVNADVILCQTSFHSKEILSLLENLWNEKYIS